MGMADIHNLLDNDCFRETRIAKTEQARKLREAICVAMSAYWDYLEREGLIWNAEDANGNPTEDANGNPARCEALIAEMTPGDYGTVVIRLKGGALDRR
jgi:mannose/cellobiose epimerase-like protein (N-acyl-D-glucosamine 2-epimerase family)